MNNKKNLGQFMTTNSEYILQCLDIPENVKNIIEPFCGNGDLIDNILEKYIIECYDIDPKKKYITKRDTLNEPPSYKNKFILTNPPYLARNKSTNKTYFDKYGVNDLFKCVIKQIIEDNPIGGILIIPLNFWSSIRDSDIQLRKDFLEVFEVVRINIFNEPVFDDTSYTVCSFLFMLKHETNETPNKIKICIFPKKTEFSIHLTKKNNYMIGGGIYNLQYSDKYKITRITSKNEKNKNTNILIKCIDDNETNKIGISIVNDTDIYIDNTPNQSARTYASLIINPSIDLDKQKKLVENFNNYLNLYRNKYHSLFLANYRESKNNIARKRISFDLVYDIIKHLLDNMEENKEEVDIKLENLKL